jgi:regulator of RNase E activity RraA
MAAAIKPIAPGLRITGQARTVATMVGDNSAIHAALGFLDPGEVLVVDAGGVEDIAVWGGVMTEAALVRQIGGVVIDGAVRDVAELRASGLAVFCRAISPRGPHKAFGGTIDGRISAGGVAVQPGDLIIGDDDGVAVVPLAVQHELLARCRAAMERETGMIESIRSGVPTSTLLGLPAVEEIAVDKAKP